MDDLDGKNKLNCDFKYKKFIRATAFILHRDFIDTFHSIFYKKLKELINNDLPKNWKWGFTDQYILTIIQNDNPNLFNKIGTDYGELVSILS